MGRIHLQYRFEEGIPAFDQFAGIFAHLTGMPLHMVAYLDPKELNTDPEWVAQKVFEDYENYSVASRDYYKAKPEEKKSHLWPPPYWGISHVCLTCFPEFGEIEVKRNNDTDISFIGYLPQQHFPACIHRTCYELKALKYSVEKGCLPIEWNSSLKKIKPIKKYHRFNRPKR